MNRAMIDRIGRNVSPHSFRHSLNTLLRDAGQDPAKIRAALGWSQESVQDSYTHWELAHLREQSDFLDDLLR
jgi:integrase